MPKALRYGLFLFGLCVVVGSLLVFVNALTSPIIKENRLKQVLPMLAEIDEDSDEFVDATGNYDNLHYGVNMIFYGMKDDQIYSVIYWTTSVGYDSGEVRVLTAINKDTEKIIATRVTTAERQTAGWGDVIYTHDFGTAGRDVSYYNEDLENIQYDEYDIISGTTASSKAFFAGVIIACSSFVKEYGE